MGSPLRSCSAGPALFLAGECLFRLRVTGTANAKRLVAAGALVALAPLAPHVSALVLALIVDALLIALALWEASPRLGVRLGSTTDAPRGRRQRSSTQHLQQEGSAP